MRRAHVLRDADGVVTAPAAAQVGAATISNSVGLGEAAVMMGSSEGTETRNNCDVDNAVLVKNLCAEQQKKLRCQSQNTGRYLKVVWVVCSIYS
jgi:hypothetical protein